MELVFVGTLEDVRDQLESSHCVLEPRRERVNVSPSCLQPFEAREPCRDYYIHVRPTLVSNSGATCSFVFWPLLDQHRGSHTLAQHLSLQKLICLQGIGYAPS